MERMPLTRNVERTPSCKAVPLRPFEKMASNQSLRLTLEKAGTCAQSTKMNTNGQATRIQPTVPPMRTNPKSFLASFKCVKAMLLAMESVGT